MITSVSRGQHSLLIAWLAVFAALALIGFRDFLSNLENNRCEMTWMYEWPQYIRVPMWRGTSKRFPRYGLYLYAEGNYADASRDLRLSGIPVLFVPGNAGSHKQVRSLASVALRKAEGFRFHFNYFTVDLDESLSGVFGGVLREQTEYVRLCVSRILWLYRGTRNPPTSVILVGHSMGGLIARGLFLLPKFSPIQVHTIITLGTPHQHPIVYFDPQLAEFYESVNKLWRSEALDGQLSSRFANVTLVSISGGHRDVLVRSSPSSMNLLLHQSQSVSAVSTSVPRVWVSIDHLCLCWCKQLVLVINRALFAMTDHATWQISEDKVLRQRVFEQYFVKNPSTSRVLSKIGSIPLQDKGYDFAQVVLKKGLWRFKRSGTPTTEDKLFLFPTDEWSAKHDFLIVLTTLDTDHWLLGCESSSGQACNNMTNLSHYAEILMSTRSVIKFAKLNFKDFPGMSYFAVHVPQSIKIDILWSEYQSSVSSTYNVQMPGLLSRKSLLLELSSNSLFANITLKAVEKSWKVYVLYIEAMDCDTSNSLIIGRVHVPWFQEDVYGYSSNGLLTLMVKLHHPKPKGIAQQVQVHLWKDPKCSFLISGQHDFYQMLGQIYRFYVVQLPCWTLSFIFLVFAWQLSLMSSNQQCESFFSLVADTPRSIRVLLLVTQSHFFISQIVLTYLVFQRESGQHGWLPNVDDLKTFIWVFPLILIISTAVIIVIALFVWISMFVRFGSRILCCFKFSFQIHTKPGLKEGFLVLIIVLVSLLFCGTLSLILTFILCLCRTLKYATLFRICHRQPVEQRDSRLLNLFESLGNLSLTLCVLLFVVIVINLPALAVWATTLKYSYHLPSDHTSLLSIVIGLNVIACDFLVKIPRSVVYLCFIIGLAVTQAPVIPLHMIPYPTCLLLTVLNVTKVFGKLNSARDKEE